MQDKYVSLDPAFVDKRQTLSDRSILWEARLKEARGGDYASAVGILVGATTSLFFYTRA